MLVHSIQQRVALDGTPVVEALVHLSPDQAGAAADAVRAAASIRYRVPALSVDEILTMRELTTVGDTLDDVRAAAGVSIVALSIARLGLLIDAIVDAPPGPALALLDGLGDVRADALRAALDGPPADIALS